MDFKEIEKTLLSFAKERDWEQFHTPKNLSMALSVETSELLELFQWLTPEQSKSIMDSDKAEAVRDELADIMAYTIRLAQVLDVDLEKALTSKMKKNAKKYPIELSKGSAKKYNEY